MECFELIGSVLDELLEEIEGTEKEKYRLISDKIVNLRAQYANLERGLNIDYSDPVTQYAYIYVYTTSIANTVAEVIRECRELRDLFSNVSARVACVGGGPGSDLLGIIKYMERSESSCDLYCYLLDRCQAWGECWTDLFEKVYTDFRVSVSIRELDVTSDGWEKMKKYLRSNLITMVYFLSEISSRKTESTPYLNHLFTSIEPGTFFLFVDNNHSTFYEWFDTLAQAHNCEIICDGEEKMKMPGDEDKENLGRHWKVLGYAASPKLRANVAYRVAIKR